MFDKGQDNEARRVTVRIGLSELLVISPDQVIYDDRRNPAMLTLPSGQRRMVTRYWQGISVLADQEREMAEGFLCDFLQRCRRPA